MIATILWLICFNVLLLYFFLVWTFEYWKKRGVHGPKPRPFVGNFASVFTQQRHIAGDIQDIYEAYKSTDNFVGIFNCRTPQLMITDAGLIRRILDVDFQHFHDNEVSTMVDENTDLIFANNPFALTGTKWEERRTEITPALANVRIKTVFPVTSKVCKNLVHYIEKQLKMDSKSVFDANDLSLRFTCDAVTDCVLGHKAESLTRNPTPILNNTKQVSDQSYISIIFMVLFGLAPALKKYKKMRLIPKSAEKFYMGLVQNSLDSKKKKKTNQMRRGVNRNRTYLLDYMVQQQEKKGLRVDALTTPTANILLDGLGPTAEVLSHCLLMLGRDSSRQAILRNEIAHILGGRNDYDVISDLKYLDACIHETLRIFSPLTFMTKICTHPIDLANKKGEKLKVDVGTPVILPIHAVMNDAEHYANPESFEPERFLEGGLEKFKDKGLYLAFGYGPRVCLGMNFALTQIKAALVEIIRNYEVRINSRTRSDNRFNPTNLSSQLDGGIWLEFDKIN